MIALFILAQILFANPHCPSDLKIDPQIKELNLKIEKKMAETSNLVTISSEADRVLGQLTRSQNPTFVNWLRQQGFVGGSPLGIASQWRKYYLRNYILNKFPTPNPEINNSVESLFKDIQNLTFEDKFQKKIKTAFAEAKKESLQYIDTLKLAEVERNSLKTRIEKIELYWLDQLKGGPFQNKPLEFLNSGLTYDKKTHQILVGLKSREFEDKASLFTVLVQKMTQSFDSCLWPQYLSGNDPFAKLHSCFRDSQSAAAKPRDNRYIEQWVFKKLISEKNVQFLKANPLCNLPNYPPEGVQKEQINSVFSDWFAAEVLGQSQYKTSTIRTDLCLLGPSIMPPLSAELSPSERFKRIYYVQPKIQATINSKFSYKYCSFID